MAQHTHRHTHEFHASGNCVLGHTHRAALVTGRAEPHNGTHVHAIHALTTFNREHVHQLHGYTGPAIRVSPNYHIHLVNIVSTTAREHRHRFFNSTHLAPNINHNNPNRRRLLQGRNR